MNLTADQLAALEAAAASWEGTPFCEGAPVKGSGVSCHHLVAEVYFEAGWLPRMPVPDGPPDWARSHSESLMEKWIEESGLFIARPQPCTIAAGDLLGFRIGRCVHHLAIALEHGRVVHAVRGHGARLSACVPDVWARRLERIWRIA